MQLSFWGAARQVTGSMFLLELEDGYKILIDCGADLVRDALGEEGAPLYRGNSSIFPFEPSEINLVILTHAHIDHSGNFPTLVKDGYEGQVLCTSPTRDLCDILLKDSANLHERRYNTWNANAKKGGKRIASISQRLTSGMYFQHHVEEAMDRFVSLNFNQRFKIRTGLHVTFIPTSHLLGAANVFLEVEVNGNWKKIGFSGDIGRFSYPLLKDPERMPEVDYLICESTYGGRQHSAEGDPLDILAPIIKAACVDKPGRLIIPAFSVGRTQALLYTLNRLYSETDFTPIKVFADSPMALASTRIYQKHLRYLNADAKEFFEDNGELFDFSNLQTIENSKESREIENHLEPCIIVSASGMITGGRIETHLKNNIGNPYATILVIGFSAPGTLGSQLMQDPDWLRIQGKDYKVQAEIKKTDIFSGHGDIDDLMQFVGYQDKTKLKKLFIVHGDYQSGMLPFQETLFEAGYTMAECPEKGTTYTLD
jgi:metallo-beta-lactamase family protein